MMLTTLLDHGKLSDLESLASPRLLRVFSPSQLAELTRSLSRGSHDDSFLAQGRRDVRAAIQRVAVGVKIVDEVPPRGADSGTRVLRLFFAQLFYSDRFLIDLRHGRFAGSEWAPMPVLAAWAPEFIVAVRQLFSAFYNLDGTGAEEALATLGLPGTADRFREHLGGDQHSVTFELAPFRHAFRRILEDSKRRGNQLSPQLGEFALYLVCLYEHLEALGGGPHDVRAAFRSVVPPRHVRRQ